MSLNTIAGGPREWPSSKDVVVVEACSVTTPRRLVVNDDGDDDGDDDDEEEAIHVPILWLGVYVRRTIGWPLQE